MWRLSGIYRDVYLFAVPKVHLADFFGQTKLDDGFTNAVLLIRPRLQTFSNETLEGWSVQAQLYNAEHRKVFTEPLAIDADIVTRA